MRTLLNPLKLLSTTLSIKRVIIPAFVILASLTLVSPILAQTHPTDCFEIKHLDFFGIKSDRKINWSENELDKLVEMGVNKQEVRTSFLIPMIVLQLRSFHPKCSESFDKDRYDKLVTIYFNMRRQDPSEISKKTIADQLDFIRTDFYAQLQDAKLLPYMRFTMDDGPLYGKLTESPTKPVTGKSVDTSFGKIVIVNAKAAVTLVALNKKDKVLWSRLMTSAYDDNLTSLEFAEVAVEETSLLTIIHLHTSERLTLFLRPNGDFLYYFHSW